MDEELVSLREAARRKGVTEDELRRAILTGELAAEPVADDRQYLVRVPAAPKRPARTRRCWFLRAAALGFLLSFLVAGCGVSTTYLCENCGSSRRTVELVRGMPIAWTTRAGEVTPLIADAYPGGCAHAWVFLCGTRSGWCWQKGEAFGRVAAVYEAASRGVLDAARDVDPRGAADLARWLLRGGATAEEIADAPRFESAEAFRTWFLARLARGTQP